MRPFEPHPQLLRRRMLTLALASAVLAINRPPAEAQPAAGTAKPKTIVVGTGSQMKPYCYIDENGELVGYEIEVIKAIGRVLPQYDFQIVQNEFQNLLLGLEADKIDVAAHQFEWNPERASKYLYADEGYTNFVLHIVVRKDRTDINSLDDLAGKTVSVGAGSNSAYIIDHYNETHGNTIKVKYASGIEALSSVKDITDGRTDATLSIKRGVDQLNRTFGDRLKIVGAPVSTSHAFHIFRKNEVALKDDFDTALRQLKQDGTLNRLSIQFLGGDYVEQE